MKLGFLCAVLACLVGCGSLQGQYVHADEATYDAMAAEYLQYVADDSELDDDQKARRLDTVNSWRRRIDEAKADLGDIPAQEGE